jgi:hypothetical protein
MPRFVAHNLMVLRPKTPIDQPLLCWENMILLEADFDADLWDLAASRAHEVDTSSEFEMRSEYPVESRWEFAGTRKIVLVREDAEGDQLSAGDELSFNRLYLRDEIAVNLYAQGEECELIAGDEQNDQGPRLMPRKSR